jgi:hypothetical protein
MAEPLKAAIANVFEPLWLLSRGGAIQGKAKRFPEVITANPEHGSAWLRT